MWIVLFVVLGIIVAVLCVLAVRRMSREEDHPVNLVSSEQMDAEDKKR